MKILLGITGGIAAYKSIFLLRLLKEAGHDVQVVMTQAAHAFVTPLTLQALSGHAVHQHLIDAQAENTMDHIRLARWPDLIVIAPASAHTLAKLTHGLADDLLTTLCLATDKTIAVAPAMNLQMWNNPATQANIDLLKSRHIQIWGPDSGLQACGETGAGRMLEPEHILAHIHNTQLMPPPIHTVLQGKRVLISAGPTQEPIDPVRYLSNHSSGKMGFALAQAALTLGAQVTLIAGPVQLTTPRGCARIDVQTADQMCQAVLTEAVKHDMFISTAAVADFKPIQSAQQKIKKSTDTTLTLTLVQNPDIVAQVAQLRHNRPIVIGFAAETNDVLEHAHTKLQAKQLDFICANDVSHGQVFGQDDNAITLIWKQGKLHLGKSSKSLLAMDILTAIIQIKAGGY